eukprot:CAMPEP_0202362338 /NCGR_PEP_ID=MMETSP1126-20121109/14551_1 /ASSEMBLY_ACC=CAM_ASM_000457 /TAXON_ID=3047 /ORGANISM="Dunaliella tertiolecta, Strain CCMP1320" /LENGTH=218 /DNA_ID=CAMNT_0048956491 /DNA_START=25 /DNA_END=681 /DNA_ORIENTATION=+
MSKVETLPMPTLGGQQQQPVSPLNGQTPAQSGLALAFGRFREYAASMFKQDMFAQQKPWSELADRTALSKPPNMAEAISRIKKNVAYFRVNYCIAVVATCAASFVLHPSSLLVLAVLLVAWGYLLFVRQSPLVISGRQISEREKMLGMTLISFITVFFLTNVGTVLLSAVGLSLTAIMLHGAFREPDNLFLDDGALESQQSFFNIFTVTPTPTGASNV